MAKERLKVSDIMLPGSKPARLRREKSAEAFGRKGWFRDKTGEAEYRYWDGSRWTEHISDELRHDDPTS